MTINVDSQNLESYVPVYDALPFEWKDAQPFIVEQLRKLADGVNSREIGFLLDQELLTGKAFIPGINNTLDGGTNQEFRSVLRKVIDFGPLPNAGNKSVPHGITFDANFTLIQMWASATDPIALQAFPIPYAGAQFADSVSLFMDATNVNIFTKTNRSSFTRVFVFVEFIQEL